MADIFNPIYNVDAGVILAKLHLAGKGQTENFFVVNSAVEGEKPGDTEEKPGKCKFNTDIKTGKFDISFISKNPLVYYKQIKLEKFKEYEKYMAEKQKEEKNPKTNDQDNNKPINSKPEENKDNEENKEQKSPELQKAYKSLVDAVQKCLTLTKGKIDENQPEEEIKKAIDEENKKRAEEFKTSTESFAEFANKEIPLYFQNFVGEKYYKKLSLDTFVKQYFNEKVNDTSKVTVKNFQIIGMTEKEINKLEEDFLKDQSKETKVKVGFKVAAELEPIE